MKVIIDTNVLVQMLTGTKTGCALTNPKNGKSIENLSLRSAALIEYVEQRNGVIIIPTPVLAEYLIGIDRAEHSSHVNLIASKTCFEIISFDEIAAMECALLPSLQELKAMSPNDTSNKIKFDRQIIAIAKAINADEIWTHDKAVYNKCESLGMQVRSLADIEPNPEQFNFSDKLTQPPRTATH